MNAVEFFAIRLPDGRWWRRGYGEPGKPVASFRAATEYKNTQGAGGAAVSAGLLEAHGGYEIVKCAKGWGEIVSKTTNGA